MEKSWIDSEEGRMAIQDVANHPESVQFLTQAGNKHISTLTTRVLESSVNDPDKDRTLIVSKAELDGARGMLKFLIQLLNDSNRPRPRKKD